MKKILLLKKYNHTNPFWLYLIQNNKLNISVEEVIDKYNGFEGELVNFYSLVDYKKETWSNLKKHDLLLYVTSTNSTIPSVIQSEFYLLGYDFGTCKEEWTIYSSIFNEILFGNINDLIAYKDHLNENLLFSNNYIAEKYQELHNNLYNKNIDVEHDEEMSIYEVWKFRG